MIRAIPFNRIQTGISAAKVCLCGAALLTVSACARPAETQQSAEGGTNLAETAAAIWSVSAPQEYFGTCDGSAVVPLSGDEFVVANDEEDPLQIYRRGDASPVRESDTLIELLGGGEPDIEGAARTGDVIYWIASHGRGEKKAKPERRVLVATRVVGTNLVADGKPYRLLIDDLATATKTAALKLDKNAELWAENEKGLNIEGLAATPDGKLLIGFRNPRPQGKALVVRIANPTKVVGGKRAKIDKLYQLDLGGRGVRSIDWSPTRKQYLIVAGLFGDKGDFKLFGWSEGGRPAGLNAALPKGFRAEALAEVSPGQFLLLSDDGTDECKAKPAKDRSFRALSLSSTERPR